MGRPESFMSSLKTTDPIKTRGPAGKDRRVREDSPMLQLYRTARDLAPLPVDVLIEGETGVGKDTLAREIHDTSGRAGPFIALNCAAVPESLAESELFGVEAGAYTGAVRSRPGKIEAAHRGTLYLDEIDSMPMSLQAKLLRVLQERGCERVGSQKFVRFDLRVLASTKLPFEILSERNQLRPDLYHRLNVVLLRVPPLSQRIAEILPLFHQFVAAAATRMGREAPPLTDDVEDRLLSHSWPGNVRELKAAADRFVLGLPLLYQGDPGGQGDGALRERLRNIERVLIRSALQRHAGSVQNASEELKLPLHTLYYRMRILGIDPGEAQRAARHNG